ncbi:MAG: helix-turn-helix transcriptional regulator [Gemmatimonadales bacterium]|nr:MAG: helix-turn-helix transcriptional regulator [Gemmatimonadales bacterium]
MGKGDFLGEFEQMVLLAVLHQDRTGYGMSIRQEIEARTGRDPSIGSVYATLDRLEEKGLVHSHQGASLPERGGRARRHFALTPEGAAALRAVRRMMDRMWAGADMRGAGGEV